MQDKDVAELKDTLQRRILAVTQAATEVVAEQDTLEWRMLAVTQAATEVEVGKL